MPYTFQTYEQFRNAYHQAVLTLIDTTDRREELTYCNRCADLVDEYPVWADRAEQETPEQERI